MIAFLRPREIRILRFSNQVQARSRNRLIVRAQSIVHAVCDKTCTGYRLHEYKGLVSNSPNKIAAHMFPFIKNALPLLYTRWTKHCCTTFSHHVTAVAHRPERYIYMYRLLGSKKTPHTMKTIKSPHPPQAPQRQRHPIFAIGVAAMICWPPVVWLRDSQRLIPQPHIYNYPQRRTNTGINILDAIRMLLADGTHTAAESSISQEPKKVLTPLGRSGIARPIASVGKLSRRHHYMKGPPQQITSVGASTRFGA